MNETQRKAIREALVFARGFLRGLVMGKPVTKDTIDVLVKLERGLGATLESTMRHDHGAYAKCSYCGRYTADPRSLDEGTRADARCDCGEVAGWSGSFEAPGPDAQWSIGRHYLKFTEVA